MGKPDKISVPHRDRRNRTTERVSFAFHFVNTLLTISNSFKLYCLVCNILLPRTVVMFSLGSAFYVVLIAGFFRPSTEYSIILNSAKDLPGYRCFKLPINSNRKLFQASGIPLHKTSIAILRATSGLGNDRDEENVDGKSQDLSNLTDLKMSSRASLIGTEKQYCSREISDALYSLDGEKSSSNATPALLLELIPKAMSCHTSFSAEEVGNALYGLRGMSGNCPEVLKLLTVLQPKIVSSNCEMNSTSLGMSFEGLRGIRRYSEVSALMDFLYCQVDTMINNTNKLQDLSCENILILGMQMALSTVELLEAFDDKYPRWENTNLIIVDEIARRKSIGQLLFTDTDIQTSKVFKKSLEYQYITLSSNYNLFGPYDSEAVLNLGMKILPQLPTSSVDFPAAPEGGNLRFCMSRDRLLSSNSMGVEAIGAKFLRKVEFDEFERWLLNRCISVTI